MDIVALSAINGRMIDLVGGKAAGLGALIKAGENVPAGFCITTNVFRRGELPRTAVVDAWWRAGRCSVERDGGGYAGRELCWAARDGSRCQRRGRVDHRDSNLLAIAGHASGDRLSGSPMACRRTCGDGCGGAANGRAGRRRGGVHGQSNHRNKDGDCDRRGRRPR
jgi:hypothetical protein